MDISALPGTDLGGSLATYDDRDAILYALAVGAPPTATDLVYEAAGLRVLPSFALTLGLWAVESAGRLGAYDASTSLHATQRLEVRSALPPSGSLDMRARVSDVWDTGTAALVDIEVSSERFVALYGIYIRGAGGFGGDRDPSFTTHALPDPPSWSTSFDTRPDQAAVYRLTGDRHPVHIDPDAAAKSGFGRPILHGLCTLGIAARSVAGAADAHPAELTRLAARFAAPVYPGERLRISAGATDDGELPFAVETADGPVLTHGTAAFAA